MAHIDLKGKRRLILAYESEEKNIRVNAITAGLVKTLSTKANSFGIEKGNT